MTIKKIFGKFKVESFEDLYHMFTDSDRRFMESIESDYQNSKLVHNKIKLFIDLLFFIPEENEKHLKELDPENYRTRILLIWYNNAAYCSWVNGNEDQAKTYITYAHDLHYKLNRPHLITELLVYIIYSNYVDAIEFIENIPVVIHEPVDDIDMADRSIGRKEAKNILYSCIKYEGLNKVVKNMKDSDKSKVFNWFNSAAVEIKKNTAEIDKN